MTTLSRLTNKPRDPSQREREQESTSRLPPQEQPGEATRRFLAQPPEAAPAVPPSEPGSASHPRPFSSLSENFRHGGWAPFRKKVEQALTEIAGVPERRLSAFRTCGCDAHVVGRKKLAGLGKGAGYAFFGEEFHIRSTKCHDRFCLPCSNERAQRIRGSLMNHMADKENLSLITLTLKASDDPLRKCLDRINRCFRLLRTKSFWKKNVQGGVAIIETKIGSGSGKWHCHVHVVAQARYLPPRDFQAAWLAVTGDSDVVDARRVGARSGAVSYITKYVTKAADHSVVTSPRHLKESIEAFKGRRLCSTFGTWRGLELMEKPDDDDLPPDCFVNEADRDWVSVGPLDAILKTAAAGDARSIYILRLLRRGGGKPPPKV